MCLNVVDCSAGSQQCGEELPRKPHGLPARGIRSGEIVQRFPQRRIWKRSIFLNTNDWKLFLLICLLELFWIIVVPLWSLIISVVPFVDMVHRQVRADLPHYFDGFSRLTPEEVTELTGLTAYMHRLFRMFIKSLRRTQQLHDLIVWLYEECCARFQVPYGVWTSE